VFLHFILFGLTIYLCVTPKSRTCITEDQLEMRNSTLCNFFEHSSMAKSAAWIATLQKTVFKQLWLQTSSLRRAVMAEESELRSWRFKIPSVDTIFSCNTFSICLFQIKQFWLSSWLFESLGVNSSNYDWIMRLFNTISNIHCLCNVWNNILFDLFVIIN